MNNEDIKSIISENISNININISFDTFVLSLILSLILSYLVSLVYKATASSLSNKEDFSNLFIPFCISTTIIITVVKSSLALSLGLVGALSIVRFRAAIKDPEELVYLFLIVSVGLGLGANQFLITIFGTLFIIFIMFVLSKLKTKNKIKSNSFMLTITFKEKVSSKKTEEIINILKKKSNYIKINSSNYSSQISVINFELEISTMQSYNFIVDKISKNFKGAEISFSSLSNLSL